MKDLELLVTVPAEEIGKLFSEGLQSVLPKCRIDMIPPQLVINADEMPEITPEPELKVEQISKHESKGLKYGQEEKRGCKKLIKFVCPDCGSVNYAMIEREMGAYKIVCRECKMDYAFREPELSKAEYTCADCRRTNVFFTPEIEDMAVTNDKCKCGHKTKLSYSVASGKYIAVEE